MNLFKKFAFTITEIMIVLVVIGTLSVVLIPIGMKAAPNKDVVMFNKVNQAFTTAIRELIISDLYFDENFTMTNDKKCVGDAQSQCNQRANQSYFCNSFASVVSAKEFSCDNNTVDINSAAEIFVDSPLARQGDYSELVVNFDLRCPVLDNLENINYVITTDNVLYYEPYPLPYWDAVNSSNLTDDGNGNQVNTFLDKDGFSLAYNLICIDTDGIKGELRPFGFGVRYDGKVLMGARAQWWSKRELSPKEKEVCPQDIPSELCDI
jgi:type II secretory pathway pseudopilin PulG